MLTRKASVIVSGMLFLCVFAVSDALAQPGAGGGGGGGGRRGGAGGNFDPNVMRQRMADQMKAALGCTDEEWTALAPKIEEVQTLQQATRGGGFGGRGRGGPGGAGGMAPTPTTDVGKAQAALQAVVDNKDAKPEEIKAALQALRDARAKAQAAPEAAQKKLTEILTLRQQAVLVLQGLLQPV
jgi:hypothetical protein